MTTEITLPAPKIITREELIRLAADPDGDVEFRLHLIPIKAEEVCSFFQQVVRPERGATDWNGENCNPSYQQGLKHLLLPTRVQIGTHHNHNLQFSDWGPSFNGGNREDYREVRGDVFRGLRSLEWRSHSWQSHLTFFGANPESWSVAGRVTLNTLEHLARAMTTRGILEREPDPEDWHGQLRLYRISRMRALNGPALRRWGPGWDLRRVTMEDGREVVLGLVSWTADQAVNPPDSDREFVFQEWSTIQPNAELDDLRRASQEERELALALLS